MSGLDLTFFFFLQSWDFRKDRRYNNRFEKCCVCEEFNSIYLLRMLHTDYAPNHLLPQSDPLKNRVMIIIHFLFFPVMVSFPPPLKPSGRFGCEASRAGGVRCDYCNEDSTQGEMRQRKPPLREAISIKILILYQIFKLLCKSERMKRNFFEGEILCGQEWKDTNILWSVLRWKWCACLIRWLFPFPQV